VTLKKCPRCELNYIREGEKYCRVCAREMKGLEDSSEAPEICAACGERPAVSGHELCAQCMRERKELKDDELDTYADHPEEILAEVEPIELEEDEPIEAESLSQLQEEEYEEDEDDDEEGY